MHVSRRLLIRYVITRPEGCVCQCVAVLPVCTAGAQDKELSPGCQSCLRHAFEKAQYAQLHACRPVMTASSCYLGSGTAATSSLRCRRGHAWAPYC